MEAKRCELHRAPRILLLCLCLISSLPSRLLAGKKTLPTSPAVAVQQGWSRGTPWQWLCPQAGHHVPGRPTPGTPLGGFPGLSLEQTTLELLSGLTHHPVPHTGPIPKSFRGSEAAPGPQSQGRGVSGARRAQVQGSGLAFQQAAAGLDQHHSCPRSGVSNESRGQGRELFIFPLEIKQEAEKVWFSLIFFFKSFLASLPHLLPIFLRGGGQRGAGNVWQLFVFNLHKPILCVCFFSFWKFSADRHFLQKS